MDLRSKIEELKARAPKTRRRRASHGHWTEPAWCVRGLVEGGMPVTDASRHVVTELQLGDEKAVESIRQAYYALKEKPWPDDTKLIDGLIGPSVDDPEDEFEI